MSQQTQKPFFHWKKNLDSKFISGEDLQASLNGLKPEMNVVIEKFDEDETFDMNVKKKKKITDLFLKEVGGKSLYKPAILNKTNAKFFAKEFESDNVWDWLNKPVTMFAQQDDRHGYIVRYRSAPASLKVDNTEALTKVRGSKDLAELKANYESLAPELKTDGAVKNLATAMKANYELKVLFESKKAKLGISDQRNYERIINETEVESYAKAKAELEAIK